MFCFYGAGDRMQGFLRAREHSAFLCDFAGEFVSDHEDAGKAASGGAGRESYS